MDHSDILHKCSISHDERKISYYIHLFIYFHMMGQSLVKRDSCTVVSEALPRGTELRKADLLPLFVQLPKAKLTPRTGDSQGPPWHRDVEKPIEAILLHGETGWKQDKKGLFP